MKYRRKIESLKFRVRFLIFSSLLLLCSLAFISGCGEGSGKNSKMPVADAGPDKTYFLNPGEITQRVTLDGGLSSHASGKMVSYEWTGAPDPDNIVSPSVMLSFGAHVFALTVTDEKGLTSSIDEVVITVFAPSPAKEYHPPEIVLETTGYAVREGAILEIPVSASDPDGETVSLTAETKIKNARFNTRSGVHSSGMFIFHPDYDQQGAYVVVFTATDPFGVRSSKTVTLRVDQVNRPPELSIPAEVTVEEGKILTVPIKATDPDRDNLSYSVENLPRNAIFLESTGVLTFMPDHEQAGTYPLDIKASDGRETDTKTLVINVMDVPESLSGPSETGKTGIDMAENPLEETAKPGMDASPPANTAPEKVSTETETAVIITNLDTIKEAAFMTGKVVSDNGTPVENATIRVQGTGVRTQTLQDGSFSLKDIPFGQGTLIVNDPNHDPALIPFDSPVNAEIRMDKIEIKSNAFDPKAEYGAGLYSLLRRGMTDITGNIPLDDASRLIRDTLIFAGGNEAGVLDPYGNQINPSVEGSGKTSLTWKGVELYSQRLAMGESVTLMELFMDIRFAFAWQASPPTFKEFLDNMQIIVNKAWASPGNPSSWVSILWFNNGRTLSHNPPILTSATRLNLFQAYLVVNSFMTAVFNHRNGWDKEFDPPGIYSDTWENILKTFTSKPLGVVTSTGASIPLTLPHFESLLKKYYMDSSEKTMVPAKVLLMKTFPDLFSSKDFEDVFIDSPNGFNRALKRIITASQKEDQIAGRLFKIAGRGKNGSMENPNLWSFLGVETGSAHSYFFAEEQLPDYFPKALSAMPVALYHSLPLSPPVILDAKDASIKMPLTGDGLVLPFVRIIFLPAEEDEIGDSSEHTTVVYRLWRLEKGKRKVTDPLGEETPRLFELSLSAYGPLDGTNRLAPKRERDSKGNPTGQCYFDIPLPYSGMSSWCLDRLGFKEDGTLISSMDPSDFEDKLSPWFSGYLDDLTAWNPPGGLAGETVHPARGILRNLTYEISPLSKTSSVYIIARATGLTRYGKTHLKADYGDSSKIFLNIPDFKSEAHKQPVTGSIFRYDGQTGRLSEFLRPGFSGSGQSGLAMDRNGNLYMINRATEDNPESQIFQFPGFKPKFSSPGKMTQENESMVSVEKLLVGSVNGSREPLSPSNPLSVAAMLMGKKPLEKDGEKLYVADAFGSGTPVPMGEGMDSQIKSIEFSTSPRHQESSKVNTRGIWAWNDSREENEAQDSRDSLNFGPNSDMAFNIPETTLFISQGEHVVQTRGGKNASFSITQDGSLFSSASGCSVCESNGEEVLFVADRASGSILRIPFQDLTEPVPEYPDFKRMPVPVDEKDKEKFISRYTILSGLDRPDHVRITDHGKAMVISGSAGIRYIPFGFSGRLLGDGQEPMEGAVITIKTLAGEKSTTTNSEGYYQFLDVDAYSVIAEVSHPNYTFTRRITLTGKCNALADEPKPCVLITEPADGAVTTAERITVRGTIYPQDGAFAKSGGKLVVISDGKTATYDLIFNAKKNSFRVPNVPLMPGANYLRVFTNKSGDYEAGGSLFSCVARTAETVTTQAVSGMAKNRNGHPLPGATVKIYVNGKFEDMVEADACGYYNARNLPLGKISIKIIG
ncbi:MAG: hypothetical protein FP816_06245 [Desulfobacteraceae bacterium]|nr:hypothetical protein [Desulfobacteraceae bacterium]